MDCISPTTHHFAFINGVTNHNHSRVDPYNTWTVNAARLRHEKDILEIGLANCVTYLNALRKRQARNERLLSADPLPPRKKRKKIQQSRRELDREIRNRQRDEQAFLNNLQACNANIYIAEGSPFTPTDFSPVSFDYTPSTTHCSIEDSEPTEISWTGWTDIVVVSPFEKRRSNPFFIADLVPDELVDSECNIITISHLNHSAPRIRNVKENDVPPVGPDALQSQHWHSLLSPGAAAFEPTTKAAFQDSNSTEQYTQTLATIPTRSSSGEQAASARRVTVGAMSRTLPQLPIQAPPDNVQSSHNALISTAVQGCSIMESSASTNRRARAKSL